MLDLFFREGKIKKMNTKVTPDFKLGGVGGIKNTTPPGRYTKKNNKKQKKRKKNSNKKSRRAETILVRITSFVPSKNRMFLIFIALVFSYLLLFVFFFKPVLVIHYILNIILCSTLAATGNSDVRHLPQRKV